MTSGRPAPARDRTPRAGQAPWRALALTGGGLAALLAGALVVGGGEPAAPSGLAGAGPLVESGLPLVTLAGRIAAVGTVGTLLLAAVLLPGPAGLPAESRRALRAASAWALAWTAATALGALLTVSRLVGTAPTSLTWESLRIFAGDTGAGRAAVLGVALSGLVAVAARRCTGAPAAGLLLVVSLSALVVPVVLSGHSAAAEDHVLAVTTLGVHVVAATVWVGGLLALLVLGRRGTVSAGAADRYSRVALACFLATAVSGVLAAVLVLGGTGAVLAALGTGYGTLLLAKTAGLTVLGVLGLHHRRLTLPRLRAGDGRDFRRFAAGEVVLLLATVTLAVALAASPPPMAAHAAAGSTGQGPQATAADPMAGHDHGELSVGVLVDGTRFHVAGPVAAGARVTVHNAGEAEVTLTAADGSFDVVVPSGTLTTFLAPQEPGEHRFTSRHSAAFADVLVVE
ncbi:copper resistance D family protein [Blastococcus sp. VKM Ac-2987]|uniref:copper resistance D family protein n=1 Tax=Blastococcus sp. VKM Ac-2987 TaxID=3004141 RepID=UPI0022ABB670|nr:CopD family protein [Blastococcus sp. VKM Ac-2987]MCZ2860903.1 CopD family protein [Blastococcus sp. VKM Ac-2987]